MKAPFLILPVALLLSSTLPATAQDWSLQTKEVAKSVFHLQANDGHCSAVLINEKDGVLLTAAHCIPDKVEGRSIAVDEKHAEVLRVNSILDLALLKVNDINGTAVALRKDDVVPGLPVSVVGFGFAAGRLKYGFGWISDKRDASLGQDRLFYAVSGSVPGDSGGALIDYTGRLVAIVQGSLAAGPFSIGYGAPTAVIDDFVKPYWPKADRP